MKIEEIKDTIDVYEHFKKETEERFIACFTLECFGIRGNAIVLISDEYVVPTSNKALENRIKIVFNLMVNGQKRELTTTFNYTRDDFVHNLEGRGNKLKDFILKRFSEFLLEIILKETKFTDEKINH